MDQLLSRLNPAQRMAATHKDGPAVVFAGAGSGKTRIITTRIAWLVEHGVSPWEILAVTFTNKAAKEMRERVLHICPVADKALVTTFHSACAKWLREFAPELGFTSDFTIYDDSDQNSVIKKIMKRGGIVIEKDASVSEFRVAINHAKTLGLYPSDREAHKAVFKDFMPTGGIEVYGAYQESLALTNAMDFGDLITNMVLLLRTNERVRKLMRARYRYILVDEYQDTNRPQMELLSLISGDQNNIFVVGDDDQSIYSWRGAVPANIIDFEKVNPTAKVFKLEDNYRCTSNIVNAASALVANNKKRADKTLRTQNPPGEKIEFRYETDGDFEASWVAESIQDEAGTFVFDQIAIFYRTNSQSRVIEDSLRRKKIPYRIFGNVRFYDRAEIKDVLAYIKLLTNPRDDVSFFRALNTPSRGLGESAEEHIQSRAREHGTSAFEAARRIASESVPRISTKISGFLNIIDSLRTKLDNLPISDFMDSLVQDISYFDFVAKKFPDQFEDKQDNVMELVSAVKDYADTTPSAKISDWLQEIMLTSESNGDEKGVNLMTLHLAKGLEFDRVYVVGLEDGLLPHFGSCDNEATLEEERRLLYVGMTRAKKKLSLSAAYMRRTWGQTQSNDVSRFLRQIPDQYVKILTPPGDTHDSAFDHGPSDGSQYYDYSTESGVSYGSTSSIPVKGSLVRHPTYGTGTVEETEGNFGRTKIIVRFRDIGLRKVAPHHLTILHDEF